VQVYPLIFAVNFVLGCSWMFFQFAFWRALSKREPTTYQKIGGPENVFLDVSIWNLGKTLFFIFKGNHRRFTDRSLRVMGDILLYTAIGFWLTFPLLFVVPPDTWILR